LTSCQSHPAPPPGPDQARSLLRAHGVRPTRQRELVYVALAATDSHPTAEELLTRVHLADPGISQATVYNTLDALTGCGLARRLASRSAGGPCRYDADVSPHVHLTLPDGRVMDAPDCVSRAILAALTGCARAHSGLDTARIAGVHIDLVADPA
jgi:Fe2+ or Zn2+ uptake regulation protein